MIIFRTDANSTIGFGHLNRCKILANAFRKAGQQCIMIGPDGAYAKEEDALTFSVWEHREWNNTETDAQYLASYAERYKNVFYILDDYRVDDAYQFTLYSKGLKWLQFESNTDRGIWANFVINTDPSIKITDYKETLFNPAAKMLLGLKYALLRDEFQRVKPHKIIRPIKKILITFGGGDDQGAILFTLSSLLSATSAEIKFHIVSGLANPRNSKIESWIKNNGRNRVTLSINPSSVAEVMLDCELAIMAGGSTTHEAIFCGLPMILISIADNQVHQSLGWQKLGVAIYLGSFSKQLSKTLLVSTVTNLLNHPFQYSDMVRKLSNQVDGNGKQRIVELVLSETLIS